MSIYFQIITQKIIKQIRPQSLEVTTKETVRNLEHRIPYDKISLSENKMVS